MRYCAFDCKKQVVTRSPVQKGTQSNTVHGCLYTPFLCSLTRCTILWATVTNVTVFKKKIYLIFGLAALCTLSPPLTLQRLYRTQLILTLTHAYLSFLCLHMCRYRSVYYWVCASRYLDVWGLDAKVIVFVVFILMLK